MTIESATTSAIVSGNKLNGCTTCGKIALRDESKGYSFVSVLRPLLELWVGQRSKKQVRIICG